MNSARTQSCQSGAATPPTPNPCTRTSAIPTSPSVLLVQVWVLRSCLWSCGALTKAGTQDEMAKALGFDNSRNPRLLSKFWALTKAGTQDGKSRKEQEPSNIQPCWLFCGFVGNSNNQANVQAGNRNNTATTPTLLRFPAWLLVLGPGT